MAGNIVTSLSFRLLISKVLLVLTRHRIAAKYYFLHSHILDHGREVCSVDGISEKPQVGDEARGSPPVGSGDAYASLHVNGTDRDGQSDNCAAGDSGFQVAFV